MRVLIVAGIFIAGVTIAYFLTKPGEKPLKVYNPVDVEPEMVDDD